MKMTKKIMSLAIVFAMVMAMSVSVFAAGNDGSITVSGAQVGESYSIYKVFDATYVADGDDAGSEVDAVSYTYTKTETDALYTALTTTTGDNASPFVLTETTTDNVYNVKLADGKDADDVVKFLNYCKTNSLLTQVGESKQAVAAQTGDTTANVTFSGLGYGYYYITSTLGSVVTVNSNLKDVTVVDKNSEPTLEKKVKEGSEWVDEATAKIGDTVEFKLTVSVTDLYSAEDKPTGFNKDIVVHDTMANGFTLNTSSFVVKVEGENDAKTAGTDYTVKTTDKTDATCTFEVVLDDAFVSTLKKTDKVVITYSAELDKDAVIADSTNDNTAWVTYSNQTSVKDTVTVKTYKFDLVKTDSNNVLLNGASFKLYASKTGTDEIKVVKDATTGIYRVADDTQTTGETIVVTGGKVTVEGLDVNVSYWLEETVAPDGYNILTEREEVKLTANNMATIAEDGTYTADTGVQVVNQSGTELPSTGGIGTTIFYALGGLMAVGAGVLLVAKKRMEA